MPRNSAALSRAQRPLARRGASAARSAATASDNRDTIAALHELPQFTVAEAVVRRRKAVANAMATGLTIPEWRPLDQQAWDEIKLLTSPSYSPHSRDSLTGM